MPLTESQKSHVNACIEHLFDLPTEPVPLKIAAAKLKQAFELEIKDEKDVPYFTLQKCITRPMSYVQRVELMASKEESKAPLVPITIGDVLTCILDLATNKLKEAETAAKQKMESKDEAFKLDWNKEAILEKIKQKQPYFDNVFRSDSTQFTWDEPFQEPNRDRIFKYNVVDDHVVDERGEYFSYHLNIEINISPENKVIRDDYDETLEAFKTARERDEAKSEDEDKLSNRAEYIAQRTLIQFLLEEKILTIHDIEQISFYTKDLITYPYYFNAIKNKIIKINEVNRMSSETYDNLISFVVMDLLEKNKLTFSFAKYLSKEQRAILENPFYCNKFLKDEISQRDLMSLTENSKNLLSPHVIQLIDKKIIEFRTAKRMTAQCRAIIDNQAYLELLLNKKITYAQIEKITPEQTKNLSTSIVAFLVCKEWLSLEEALWLNLGETRRQLLDHPTYFRVVQKNPKYFHFFVYATFTHCGILLSPQISRLFDKEVITPDQAIILRLSRATNEVLDNKNYYKVLNKDNFNFFLSLTDKQSEKLLTDVFANLVGKEILTPKEVLSSRMSFACRQVLSNQTYLKIVNKENFHIFMGLTDEQKKTLFSPIILRLVDEKIIQSVQEALNTKVSEPCERLLINFSQYLKLAKQNKQNFKLLQLITPEQYNVLSARSMLHLVGPKISLQEALKLKLSDSCRAVLNTISYSKFIKQNLLDFKFILSLNETQTKFLARQYVINAFKNGNLSLNTVKMTLKNPLILRLFEESLLEVVDLHAILPSENASSEFKLPNLNIFKNYNMHVDAYIIMRGFLILAHEGLLFEKDLDLLFENLFKIKVAKAPSPEQRSSIVLESAKCVLANETMMNAAKRNIFCRIEKLEKNEQMMLVDDKKDSLSNLIFCIGLFNIRCEDIWAAIFSARIMGIFVEDPYMVYISLVDDIELLKKDMKAYVTKLGSDQNSSDMSDGPNKAIVFRQLLIKNVIEKIKDYLKSKLEKNADEFSEIHAKIDNEMNLSLKKEKEEKSEDSLLWAKTFTNILKIAQDTQRGLWSDLFGAQSNEPPAKRQRTDSSAFFKPKSELKDFCKSLCSLSDILDIYDQPVQQFSLGSSSSASLATESRKRGFLA